MGVLTGALDGPGTWFFKVTELDLSLGPVKGHFRDSRVTLKKLLVLEDIRGFQEYSSPIIAEEKNKQSWEESIHSSTIRHLLFHTLHLDLGIQSYLLRRYLNPPNLAQSHLLRRYLDP